MSPTDPTSTPASPSRQRRKEARPQELLDAALDLFVEKGFALTQMEAVAAQAGVSKGTLYLYYSSKDELLKAVIRLYLAEEIAAGGAEVDAYTGPASGMLTVVLAGWWHRVFDSRASGVFKLAITEMRNFPDIADFYIREVMTPGEQVVARILERGIRSGEFRSVPVAHAVQTVLMPLVLLCVHKHSLGPCAPLPDFDAGSFIDDHLQLVLHGMLAPAST